MTDSYAAFLAGNRPDDVVLFLADSYVSDDRLAEFGAAVDDGVLIVVDGDRGRNAFQAATGTEAMAFAKEAMQQEGAIADELTDGTCPDEASDEGHEPQFIFAFAEEQNENVGGIYADGDVIHAYAKCTCGTSYSDRWNAIDVDA